MNSIYTHYCSGNAAVAKMLTIYIEEAHAVDEWVLPESEVEVSGETAIPVHQNISERISAARRLVSNRGILSETVCDSMAGQVCDRYRAWPERLYIIVDGVVVEMDLSDTSCGRCKNGWGKSMAFAERAYESDNNS